MNKFWKLDKTSCGENYGRIVEKFHHDDGLLVGNGKIIYGDVKGQIINSFIDDKRKEIFAGYETPIISNRFSKEVQLILDVDKIYYKFNDGKISILELTESDNRLILEVLTNPLWQTEELFVNYKELISMIYSEFDGIKKVFIDNNYNCTVKMPKMHELELYRINVGHPFELKPIFVLTSNEFGTNLETYTIFYKSPGEKIKVTKSTLAPSLINGRMCEYTSCFIGNQKLPKRIRKK